MPPIAVGRIENQNEPKRSPPCGRLGSFWFSTRFVKKSDPPCAENRVVYDYTSVRNFGCKKGNFTGSSLFGPWLPEVLPMKSKKQLVLIDV